MTGHQNEKIRHANPIRISTGDKAYYTITYTILGLFTLLIIMPLINVVANSFSSQDAVAFGWVTFWPVDFTLKGYRAVFTIRAYGQPTATPSYTPSWAPPSTSP